MSNPLTTPTHQVANFLTVFTDSQTDHTTYGVDAVR